MNGAKFLVVIAACCPPDAATKVTTPTPTPTPAPTKPKVVPKDMAMPEEIHLKNVHQLTFGGDNAEAYWAFGGDRLIMQTNRKPYECDQIEVLPINGDSPKLVSTGKGRTTCSYFLKGDKEIVYGSTHEASPKCPTPPDMSKGYVWGLFEFDIYRANADGSNIRNLTPKTPGYDAEATVCATDGTILFTSTRSGDPELYRMDADGKNIRQLTNMIGYDGGAFFSNDCTKIVWRSSRPQPGKELDEYKALLAQNLVKPTKMDLYVANADGSDARQVTFLAGASFAPFFYPDGKRILFSSNFKNPRSGDFDLFAIDIDGSHLEQITYSGGFDGFPMFSPDGKKLAFSSNRRDTVKDASGEKYRATGTPAGEKDTNVFIADWVDTPRDKLPASSETEATDRFARDVAYLADDAREGRGVGTKGLVDTAKLVETRLKELGIGGAFGGCAATPGTCTEQSYRQELEVTTELKRNAKTELQIDGKAIVAEDYTPLSISKSGAATGAVVAVGWGIIDKELKIDDYAGKAVAGKIALVHRFVPPADPKAPPGGKKIEGRDAARLGDLRAKAFLAKQRGATALIVVDDGDPTSDEAPLPKLHVGDGISQIPIIVMKRAAGAALRTGNHTAKLTVALDPVRTKTANIVGVIKAGAAAKLPGVVVVGAHMDHLGMGGGSNALDPDVNAVHNGADDNASGVAGLLEVARSLAAKRAELQRDVYIIAFTAEEMGVLGSEYYVKHLPTKEPIVAMLNMDMIGRMKLNRLHVNGGDSAKEWKELVGPLCTALKLDCTIAGSGYGPSDHVPFYIAGAPVLFMFTGSHREYHTANDDSHLINAAGGVRVAQLTADVAAAVAKRPGTLTYVKAPPEPMGGDVRRRGASLGTMPSYGEDPNAPKGMTIAGVHPDGPAAKAGLKANDRIIQIGTAEIASVSDLMFVLEQAKPGQQVTITFVRDNKIMQVTATYGAPRPRK